MKSFEDMSLNELVELYVYGDCNYAIPPYGITLSKNESEYFLKALKLVFLLSREEPIHNLPNQRTDIQIFGYCQNALIENAQNFVKECPIYEVK